MKAIVWTKYNSFDGLILKDVKKPEPKDNEVLIKVKAATVTAGDCEIRSLKLQFPLNIALRFMFGFKNPKDIILGQEFAGEISEIGKDVTKFKIGDKVFGTTGFSFGAYAQYLCLPEKSNDRALITMPSNISFDEAAGIPVGGLEALHFFRKSKVNAGDEILINGAGGSIGTIAIQLFKNTGAIVTAVDTQEKSQMMRSAGADYVIDYKSEDFTNNNKKYDIVFDVVGKSPFFKTLSVVNNKGRYMLANPKILKVILGSLLSAGKKIIYGTAEHNNEDLQHLKMLIEQKKIHAVIDKKMPLIDVPKAHEYVEQGLKKGNLIITIE